MDLFAADIFSQAEPQLRPAEFSDIARVDAVLKQYYSTISEPQNKLEAFGGQGINSSNFLIKTAAGEFVIKSQSAVIEEVRQVLRLASWLREQSVPVLEVIASDSGDIAVESAGKTWSVTRFASGNHFSGANDELAHVGACMQTLHDALQTCPAELLPTSEIAVVGEYERQLFAEMDSRRDQWPDILGDETARVLHEHWTFLNANLNEALKGATQAAEHHGVMHIDLHPHNWILAEGKVAAVLDLDSLRMCSTPILLSFACLKLLRQAACQAKADSKEAATLAPMILQAMPCLHGMPVGLFARMEVMRRIGIILHLCLRHADHTWNHVLPVHIRTLHEAKVLFGA